MKKLVPFLVLALMVTVFIGISSPTLAGKLPNDPSLSQADSVVAATLNPVADSFVRKDYPNTNYGSFSEVRAQSSPLLIGYLKFSVSGLTSPVTKATLRMYSLAGVTSGYKVYRVTDNSWSESTINYNNSPYLGTYINASGAVSSSTWTSVDVTSYITGNGTYSFGLTDPGSTMIRLGSRESTNKPQLIVETGSTTATATPTRAASATATKSATAISTSVATAAPKPTNTPTVAPTPSSTSLLWSGTMETGDLSQWNNGGGEFDSGTAYSVASKDVAHSGSWSAKLITTTPPESGTRLFRWHESQTYPSLYYSTWYYFPRNYAAPNYWNIFQFKSKISDTVVDPFYVLNVGNNSSGGMYLYLYDWQRQVSYSQSQKTLPAGQWVHVEAFYKCAPDSTGQITIWQDGTQLFNVTGKSTRYSNGDCQWSVNNYSDSLSPSPATIYVDDAAESLAWIP